MPRPAKELLRDRLRAERCQRVTDRWPTPGSLAAHLDPTTRNPAHLRMLDEALVDVAEGRCKRLIVVMPPQEGKSERTSHYGALWMLTRNPDLRIAIASYGESVARRWGQVIRNDVIAFPQLALTLQEDSKAAGNWNVARPHTGSVYCVGVGGSLTGRPVDVLFIDDPVKDRLEADSATYRENVWSWWTDVARTRLAPNAPVVLIMTRWHEDDLAGRLQDREGWRVLRIPAQAEPDDLLGRPEGVYLDSARDWEPGRWDEIKTDVGSRTWNALYQGRPTPDTGNVWLRHWWRRYDTLLWTLDESGAYRVDADEVIQSWDMSFKDTKGSDFVVGGVLARRGAQVYVLDVLHRRLSFTDTLTAFEAVSAKWPQATAKLVEDKANGTAVIDTLRRRIPGIVPVTPTESKYSRATACSPFIEAGNVLVPAPGVALFDTDGLIDEAAAFPNGAHDDRVDMLSQALARLLLLPGRRGRTMRFHAA